MSGMTFLTKLSVRTRVQSPSFVLIILEPREEYLLEHGELLTSDNKNYLVCVLFMCCYVQLFGAYSTTSKYGHASAGLELGREPGRLLVALAGVGLLAAVGSNGTRAWVE
jgi:hypothetical protein